MDCKSANSSPESLATEMRAKRPKPTLTLSYHLPTGVVQGSLSTRVANLSQGVRSPALIPIRSPIKPAMPHSPFGASSAILKAPHLSQSKDAFSPLPPTPTSANPDITPASVFQAFQDQFLQSKSTPDQRSQQSN